MMNPVSVLKPWLFAIVSIAGCASNQAPQLLQSTEAGAAKVRFIAKAEQGAIYTYPENRCNAGVNVLFNSPGREMSNSFTGYKPPRIAMLDSPYLPTDHQVAEYAFAPGQILNLGARSGSCIKGMSMTLRAEEQYEISLESGCALKVRELRLIDGVIRREIVRDIGPLICDGRAR